MNFTGIGTLANVITILCFSLLGTYCSRILSDNLKETLRQCIGLVCMAIGLHLFIGAHEHILANVCCLMVGVVIGEGVGVHAFVENTSLWLRNKVGTSSSTFALGFVVATSFYLTGDMFIIGSIQDGATGDPTILYWKTPLDAISAFVLAAEYGAGVTFSAFPVLIVQGAITLLAYYFSSLLSPNVLEGIRGVGGIVLLALGLYVLNIVKDMRVFNLMPGIAVVALWEMLKR